MAACLATALVYLLLGVAARALTPADGFATPFWPAAGAALAAVLVLGTRVWPGLLAGAVLAELYRGGTGGDASLSAEWLLTALAIAAGAAGQAVLGAWLVRRRAHFDHGLLRGRDVLRFLLLGGPASCAAGAAWTGTVLALAAGPSADWLRQVALWWLGDSLGVLVATPVALALLGRSEAWRRRRALVALPMLAALCAALLLHDYARERESDRLRLEFGTRAEALRDRFEGVVRTHVAAVRSIASVMSSVPGISRQEFGRFARNLLRELPGTQALSWNPDLPAAAVPTLEAQARAKGLPSFRVWQRAGDGSAIEARGRERYVPVHFIEPLEGNRQVIGFDISSEPLRAATLEAAREARSLHVTEPLRLVQETGAQAGVLVVLPVFDGGDGDARHPRGYAVGVLRLGDVLAAAFRDLPDEPLDAALADVTDPATPLPLSSLHLDHRHEHADVVHHDEPEQPVAYRAASVLEIGGRRWELVMQAPHRYMADLWSLAPVVALGGGLLFVSLLGGFLLALSGRSLLDQHRARELADEVAERKRTARALSEEKERAEVTLHSIGDAVITTDATGRVEYLNPVAETMTGWPLSEAKDQPLAEVLRIFNEFTGKPADDPVQRCLREGRVTGLANHTVLVSRAGRRYSIQDSAAPIRDSDGVLLGVVLVFNDVTESRRMAREAERAASLDPLTELLNRREFERRLDNALHSSRRYGARHALCFIDLDQFKVVNDSAGHRAGDTLLKELSGLLLSNLRDRDTLARLGGDEFGLLLDNCPLDKAAELAQEMIALINEHRFTWEGRSFRVGASMGVVPVTGRSDSSEEVMANADIACYAAKDAGRNRVYVYDTDSGAAHPRHLELRRAAELRSALEEGRFSLYVQPIVALHGEDDGSPPRHEVLLRLRDAGGTLLEPASFIPAAERFGLMDAIDRWVVRHALTALQSLHARGVDARLAINLSGNSLNGDALLGFLEACLRDTGVPGQAVCFEITETAAIHDLEQTVHIMTTLGRLGCRFSLDDFGSGLSSFRYLKRLPVDSLKIYGGLVREIATDPNDRAMVRAVNQVAHEMGIRTIAEWVESEACLRMLREMGVDYAQGHALGEARPIETLLEAWRPA